MRKHITPWEPLKEMDRFLDNNLLAPFVSLPRFGGDLAVDLYEEDGKVIAKMSLPGMKPDELDITLDEDTLTVSGKRAEEKETKDKDYYQKEIRHGSFSRTLTLPRTVDAITARATYEDGVLTVAMQALGEPKGKPVKIAVGK